MPKPTRDPLTSTLQWLGRRPAVQRMRGWLVGETYVTSHLAYMKRASSFDNWANGPMGISVALRLAYEAFPSGSRQVHEIAILLAQPVKRLELVVTATAGTYHIQEDVILADAKPGTIHRRQLPSLPLLRLWYDRGIRVSVEQVSVDLRYAELEDGGLAGSTGIHKIRPVYDPYLRSRWGRFDRRAWNLDLIVERQQEIARRIHRSIAGDGKDPLDRALANFLASPPIVRAWFWLPIFLGFGRLTYEAKPEAQKLLPPPSKELPAKEPRTPRRSAADRKAAAAEPEPPPEPAPADDTFRMPRRRRRS